MTSSNRAKIRPLHIDRPRLPHIVVLPGLPHMAVVGATISRHVRTRGHGDEGEGLLRIIRPVEPPLGGQFLRLPVAVVVLDKAHNTPGRRPAQEPVRLAGLALQHVLLGDRGGEVGNNLFF